MTNKSDNEKNSKGRRKNEAGTYAVKTNKGIVAVRRNIHGRS